MERNYTREEVEEILGRAIRQESQGQEGLSHDELLAVAREAGIASESVERAAEDLADDRERKWLLARVRDQRRRGFWRRLIRTGAIVGVSFVVDLFITNATFWPWVLLGMSFPLLRSLVRAYFPSEGDVERAVDAEARRHAENREKHRKRRESLRREAQFKAVLERLADLVLGAADKHLDRIAGEPPDFGRPPRVRIERDSDNEKHGDRAQDAERDADDREQARDVSHKPR